MSFVSFNTKDFNEKDDFDEVNFDDYVDETKEEEEEENNIQKIEYDKITIQKYKALRYRKMDPIAYVEVDEEYAFKFKYIWDPYTGERKNILDENGPLYFDPDILIKHYFTKMLSKL